MATKKQHYIPRMLLKNFTEFYIPMRKPLIYQYDKDKGIERRVDIYDICRKNNLYEIKDESGRTSEKEINLIENGFSCLEAKWNIIIDKITKEQGITQNDRCMLGLLLVLQVMRTPEIIKFTSRWLHDISTYKGKSLTENEADRYMKLASFVWGKLTPETNWILYILLEKILDNKDVIICHSYIDFILNGARPVLCLKSFENDNNEKCQWIFPITKNYCITLVDKGTMQDMDIDERYTNFINACNFQNDGRFIYGSKSILQRKELINYKDNTVA